MARIIQLIILIFGDLAQHSIRGRSMGRAPLHAEELHYHTLSDRLRGSHTWSDSMMGSDSGTKLASAICSGFVACLGTESTVGS